MLIQYQSGYCFRIIDIGIDQWYYSIGSMKYKYGHRQQLNYSINWIKYKCGYRQQLNYSIDWMRNINVGTYDNLKFLLINETQQVFKL